MRALALLIAASLDTGCSINLPGEVDQPTPVREPEDPPDNTVVMIAAVSTIAVVGTLFYLGYRHQVRQQHRR